VRRGFDHLAAEISVRAGRPVARWTLWLRVREAGLDPERLSRADLGAFCERELAGFLAEQGIRLAPRTLAALRRAIVRCDPLRPTPAEWAAPPGAR
jgi:hypothetical protein